MGKMATKESVERLQSLFDLLGDYGGTIETEEPDTWWTLRLIVLSEKKRSKKVLIEMIQNFYLDIIHDG